MEHLLFVVLVGLANGAAIRSFSLDERLQAACDSDGVAVIELEPGHHYLSKTLVLPKACNGLRLTSKEPLAPAILDGGIVVSGWQPVNGTSLWRASIPSGVEAYQLWVNGERRTFAQSKTIIYKALDVAKGGTSYNTIIADPKDLLTSYADAKNMLALVYRHWTADFHSISSIDSASGRIVLDHNVSSRWTGDAPSGSRIVLLNSAGYLKEGTFAFDNETATLTYQPLPDEVSQGKITAEVVVAGKTELVSGVDVHNVEFSNVVFQHAAAEFGSCLRGDCSSQSAAFLTTAALHWQNSTNITLSNVTVKHTGGYGVWFDAGTVGAVLSHSLVEDVGAGAVRIGVPVHGVAPDLTSDVVVEDCELRDGGHVYKAGCGVLLQAAANSKVTHNNIHWFHYTGVSVGWTWNYIPTSNENNEVSYNRIYDIGLRDLSDMGCIYHLGQDNGTRITNNICHNVTSFDYGGWGYYTDQASRNVVLENNIAYNTKCGGFHQHYGLNNTLRNNIFFNVNRENCDVAIRSSAHNSPGDEGDNSSFSFMQNIVDWTDGELLGGPTVNGFIKMTFDNNVYHNTQANKTITFPCPPKDPYGGQWYLEGGQELIANETLYSQHKKAYAKLDAGGRFCIGPMAGSTFGEPLWCTTGEGSMGFSYRASMQGDGNFCVGETAPEQKVFFCDMVSANGSQFKYFALLEDDCTFCVHNGTYPSEDYGTLWCASNKTCGSSQLADFPNDCSLDSWHKRQQDLHSVIADPMFADPKHYNFTVLPNSPALPLGFKNIDTSTVGPR